MATTRGTQEKLDMGSENDGTEEPPPSIEEILHGTAHAMTIFTAKEKAALDARIFFKKSKPYLECYATGKDRSAKPEEIVRQLYLKKLMDHYGYPVERIAVVKRGIVKCCGSDSVITRRPSPRFFPPTPRSRTWPRP